MKIYADQPEHLNQPTVKSENPNAFSDSLTNPTEKEKLKDLQGKKKIQYIWDYYKTPIIITVLVLLVATYVIYDHIHQKTTVVTITCANVSVDEELEQTLTTDFLENYVELSPSKYQIVVDSNLMVGEEADTLDAQYAYSSQMKLMAYIASGQMDLVFMNQTAFDHLSDNGFLEDLSDFFAETDPELNEVLKNSIVTNEIVIEDNSQARLSNPDLAYEAVTETHPLALRLTGSPFFPEGYFNQDVYVGVAVNTTKKDASVQFLRYLFGLEPGDYTIVPEK